MDTGYINPLIVLLKWAHPLNHSFSWVVFMKTIQLLAKLGTAPFVEPPSRQRKDQLDWELPHCAIHPRAPAPGWNGEVMLKDWRSKISSHPNEAGHHAYSHESFHQIVLGDPVG